MTFALAGACDPPPPKPPAQPTPATAIAPTDSARTAALASIASTLPTTGESSAFALAQAATETVVRWTKAGQPVPPGGVPGDLGPEFWLPPIRELRPLRAYTHQLNLVLVTNRGPTLEEGFYLSVSYSSYLPGAPGSADGRFEFPDITISPVGVMTVPDGPLRYRKRLRE